MTDEQTIPILAEHRARRSRKRPQGNPTLARIATFSAEFSDLTNQVAAATKLFINEVSLTEDQCQETIDLLRHIRTQATAYSDFLDAHEDEFFYVHWTSQHDAKKIDSSYTGELVLKLDALKRQCGYYGGPRGDTRIRLHAQMQDKLQEYTEQLGKLTKNTANLPAELQQRRKQSQQYWEQVRERQKAQQQQISENNQDQPPQ